MGSCPAVGAAESKWLEETLCGDRGRKMGTKTDIRKTGIEI